MPKKVVAILIGLLLIVCVDSLPTDAQEKVESKASGYFHGNIVIFVTNSLNVLQTEDSSETLVDPVMETIGGRLFVTGTPKISKQPEDAGTGDWRSGARIGIAWDEVQRFYIYTPEQFTEMEKAFGVQSQ